MTQQNPNVPADADDQAARLAELHAQCRADYAHAAEGGGRR